MATFRQRPLTWLFCIAVGCVAAVGLAADRTPEWISILLVGGTYAICTAAALSQRHRLARATMFLAGIAASELVVIRFDGVRGEAVALIAAMGVAAFLSAAATRQLLSLGTASRASNKSTTWRFPVIEILGWMIVVAVASAGLRYADLGSLLHWTDESSLLLHAVCSGVMTGLFLTPERHCDRLAIVVSTTIVGLAIVVVPQYLDDWLATDDFLVPLYAFVAMTILVQRLDDSARSQVSSTRPSLAIVSLGESHDE